MIEMQIFGYNSGPRIKLPSTIYAGGTSATQVAIKTYVFASIKNKHITSKKECFTIFDVQCTDKWIMRCCVLRLCVHLEVL